MNTNKSVIALTTNALTYSFIKLSALQFVPILPGDHCPPLAAPQAAAGRPPCSTHPATATDWDTHTRAHRQTLPTAAARQPTLVPPSRSCTHCSCSTCHPSATQTRFFPCRRTAAPRCRQPQKPATSAQHTSPLYPTTVSCQS